MKSFDQLEERERNLHTEKKKARDRSTFPDPFQPKLRNKLIGFTQLFFLLLVQSQSCFTQKPTLFFWKVTSRNYKSSFLKSCWADQISIRERSAKGQTAAQHNKVWKILLKKRVKQASQPEHKGKHKLIILKQIVHGILKYQITEN